MIYQTGYREYIDVDYKYQYQKVYITNNFDEALEFSHLDGRNYLWKINLENDDMVEQWDENTRKWHPINVEDKF